MNSKAVIKVILLMMIVIFISACTKESNVVEDIDRDPEPSKEEDKEIEPEEPSFPYTHPLTGIGTEDKVDQRVVGVTINNHPAARPQSGVIDADIVYEVLAEGEMTRFVALFHSKLPERVGPVRSSRPYLIDLVKGYDGMLVTHGWSPEAERLLNGGYADFLNGLSYDGTLFKRSSDRKAPHNSYITFDNIIEGMESRGYDMTGDVSSLTFYEDDDITVDGTSGKEIEINYLNRNYVNYVFDEQSGFYERFNGDQQTVDYETNDPIQISNVLVIETDHKILDDVGRRAVDLTSGGNAILFQNGVANDISWENRNGRIIPVQNGEVVSLTPGQTWINIVPSSPGMESAVTYE